MKYIQTIKQKVISYKFPTIKKELEYIETCQAIWGCVPCDVLWATETSIYKNHQPPKPLNNEDRKRNKGMVN